MAVSFPDNAVNGQTFDAGNGTIYVYKDGKWLSSTSNNSFNLVSGAIGATGATGPAGSLDSGSDIVAGIVTADFIDGGTSGIITAEYMYGGFIGTMYNTVGNPIARSEDASFIGNFLGDVYSGSSGFSTFKDLMATGVTTVTYLDATPSGIVTAEYIYGGFIGTVYNTTGNPILRSEDASFGGTVYGDIITGSSGFSTFKDVMATGVTTVAYLDASSSGIVTAEYIYGGFIGTVYNTTGNPILRSEDASFGGTVYGDVITGSSGFSTFKDVVVAGVSTFTAEAKYENNITFESAGEHRLQYKKDGDNTESKLIFRSTGDIDGYAYKDWNFYAGNDPSPINRRLRLLDAGGTILEYENANKLETTASGVSITGDLTLGDNNKVMLGADDDLQIHHTSGNSFIQDKGSGILALTSNGSGISFMNDAQDAFLAKFEVGGQVELYYDNSKKIETTSSGVAITGDLTLGDNNKIRLGVDDDLQIFHDGGNSVIKESGTGDLILQGAADIKFTHPTSGDVYAVFNADDSSELYFDNSKKLHTTAAGVEVSGVTTVSGDSLGPVAITLSGYNATIDGTYELQPYVGFIGNRPDSNRDYITNNSTYQNPIYRKTGGPSDRTYDYLIVAAALMFGPPEEWSVISTDIDLATQTASSNRIADAITQQYGLQSVVDSTSPPVEDANTAYVLGAVGVATITIGGQGITGTEGIIFQSDVTAGNFVASASTITTLIVDGEGNFEKLYTNNMENSNRGQNAAFDFAIQRGVISDSFHFPAKFGVDADRFVMLQRDNFQFSIDQDVNETYGISLGYYSGGNRFNHTSIFQANLADSSVSLGDPQEDATSPKWLRGTGTPEGVVSAPVGSFYSRTDGGSGSTWYVKESGTGNTGWVAK